MYLYRAVDSSGATIDFLLSAKRDAAAAERFLAKALGGENLPTPRIINTDLSVAKNFGLGGGKSGLDRLVAGVGQLGPGGGPWLMRHRADDAGRPERQDRRDDEPDGGERCATGLPLHGRAS